MWRAKSVLKMMAAVGLAAGCVAPGVGCAARPEPATFGVEDGEYDRAFVATRDVLRDINFEIERVDATRGVITTKARPDSGFFTPWTGYQLDAASALEGSLNQQRRRVRVTFIPVADEAAYIGGGGDQDRVGSQLDEVASRGPWTAYVDVGVTRMQTSGLRPPPRTVLLSSVSVNPIEQAQGVATIYEVPVSQDTALAAAITRRIRTRLGMSQGNGATREASGATQTPGRVEPQQAAPREPEPMSPPTEPAPIEPAPIEPAPIEPTDIEPAPPTMDPTLIPVPPRR